MPKYSTEIRKVFQTFCLKVWLADNNDLPDVRIRLLALQSVKNVNITNNDLTVYPKPPYSVNETKISVETALETFYSSSAISSSTIEEAKTIRDSLATDSKAKKCYNDALSKLSEGKYDRNTIDDLRLALETELKDVLGNGKPLEKQTTYLKEYYEKKGLANELINAHTTSFTFLCRYFNNHAKHDYNVSKNDMDTAISYANQIMRSLTDINK